MLILGNSILEGVGTALLIPPVYILTALLFSEVTSRARAFGAISAMGGIGAAAGPLLVITAGASLVPWVDMAPVTTLTNESVPKSAETSSCIRY